MTYTITAQTIVDAIRAEAEYARENADKQGQQVAEQAVNLVVTGLDLENLAEAQARAFVLTEAMNGTANSEDAANALRMILSYNTEALVNGWVDAHSSSVGENLMRDAVRKARQSFVFTYRRSIENLEG